VSDTRPPGTIGNLLLEGLRFGSVGLCATGIYLVTAVLADSAGLTPQFANALGYCVAAGVSFLGHFHWTFGKRANHASALARFLMVLAGGYLTTSAIMHVAISWFGTPFWMALTLVVLVVPGLSWLSNRYWAFK
jgi:putative flippase GtrA